jgi:hypothetical protein
MKKTVYKSERSTYDPTLDRFQGKIIFKEKHQAAEEFLRKHGLLKEFYKKDDL